MVVRRKYCLTICQQVSSRCNILNFISMYSIQVNVLFFIFYFGCFFSWGFNNNVHNLIKINVKGIDFIQKSKSIVIILQT